MNSNENGMQFQNSNNDGNTTTTTNVKEKSNVSERKGSLDYLNEQMNGPQKEVNCKDSRSNNPKKHI